MCSNSKLIATGKQHDWIQTERIKTLRLSGVKVGSDSQTNYNGEKKYINESLMESQS